MYRSAGAYYEHTDQIPLAFQLYEKAGDQERLTELLISHSKRNPAAGNYFELKRYYFQLPGRNHPAECGSDGGNVHVKIPADGF
ncbi:MAG: hypothetical protein V8S98_11790 [Lachnospiraceae bacterium]